MTPQLSASLPQRFWDKVVVSARSGCWLWTGRTTPGGYGHTYVGRGKDRLAHRAAYVAMVGPIPLGLQIDHVKARGCSSILCCNPLHLEVVTARENVLRGDTEPAKNAVKTHCPAGHPYEGKNLHLGSRGSRYCRTCGRERAAAKRKKNGAGLAPASKTHCPQGHAYAGPNLGLTSDGGRYCKECRRLWQQAFRLRMKKNRSK